MIKKLFDYNTGEFLEGRFNQTLEYEGAQLGYFVVEDEANHMCGESIAVVCFTENEYFTPTCWKDVPDMSNPDEILEVAWVYADGQNAYVVSGLPRVLLRC